MGIRRGFIRGLRTLAWAVVTVGAWAVLVGAGAERVVPVERPENVPTWQASDRATGCEPSREGVIYPTLLVVDMSADRIRMDFDKAWDRNHNESDADDVWVIGGCPTAQP